MQTVRDSIEIIHGVIDADPHWIEYATAATIILTLFMVAYYTRETYLLRRAAEAQVNESRNHLRLLERQIGLAEAQEAAARAAEMAEHDPDIVFSGGAWRDDVQWITFRNTGPRIKNVRMFTAAGEPMQPARDDQPTGDGHFTFALPENMVVDAEFPFILRFRNQIGEEREVEFYFFDGKIRRR